MNMVLTYLRNNWDRLQLRRFGNPTRLSSVLLTPRFQASSHVVAFILANEKPEPALVAKVPRLRGNNQRLDKEAGNLHQVQAVRTNGFKSIPRVIANDDFHGYRLLIETAVLGQTMKPAIVRRSPDKCLQAVFNWLVELNLATIANSKQELDWFARLVDAPLDDFQMLLPRLSKGEQLIERTRAISWPLHNAGISLVFEHSDLSSPNILIEGGANIGVVDWELANPKGLPAADLFFFLTYIAFAQHAAKKQKEYLHAFHKAFFGKQAWARSHVLRYAQHLQLSPELLRPLFVLCWARYVSGLVSRLSNMSDSAIAFERSTEPWLIQNRYFALWKHALQHLDELAF